MSELGSHWISNEELSIGAAYPKRLALILVGCVICVGKLWAACKADPVCHSSLEGPHSLRASQDREVVDPGYEILHPIKNHYGHTMPYSSTFAYSMHIAYIPATRRSGSYYDMPFSQDVFALPPFG
ncbi:hypothetical protein JB92DRAFT_3091990 [Gautieria morchelliformis]|nr:hypothetical protein JB92DRAFT_3091990 [Gautieria morchelliformis]